MIVYRFSHPKYADDISGTGAKLVGGRWNLPGTALVYTSASISLALLEVLVNASTLEQLQVIQLMEIELPETGFHEVNKARLKKNWWNDFEYTQWMGSEIIRSNAPLIIQCPSVVVDKEHNYLLNPAHAQYNMVKIKASNSFRFDERLFKV